MPATDGTWSAADHETLAILHAVAAVVALGQTLDRRTIAQLPSLPDLIGLAGTVAEELGWDDGSSRGTAALVRQGSAP